MGILDPQQKKRKRRRVSAARASVGAAQDVVQRVGNAIIGGDFTGNARGENAIDIQVSRTAVTQVAAGNDSAVYGARATAGQKGSAFGVDAVAGDSALAAGNDVTAGTSSVGLGYQTDAGQFAVAVGPNATAGDYSAALGNFAKASLQGTALGINSVGGINGTAVGGYANAGVVGTAVGLSATAGDRGVALGQVASAGADEAVISAQTLKLQTAVGTKRTVWHEANDGVGSGLDADKLDGLDSSAFAASNKGVTNGDSHDHNGGDGAQINHATLANIGTNTHAQIDTHISNKPFSAHANNPACRAYHNTAQSVPNNAYTALALNSERFDTDSIHDLTTNNSRLTCQTAGKYVICGSFFFVANAVGRREIWLYVNGATYIGGMSSTAPVSGAIYMATTTLYELVAGDYVQLLAFQNSGAALNVNMGANYSPELSMVRVG